METLFDYKLYEDNAGFYSLFVRDFGGQQLHDVTPALYCFVSGRRGDVVSALGEIISSPGGVDLSKWVGFGVCDDPEGALAEIEAIVDAGNGGARLVLIGDIYA